MSGSSMEPFKKRRYWAQTLDPVHVGTGEFQLGRVDNTIVREAGTNLPKIPGSSLAGVARAYTAMKVEPQRYAWNDNGASFSCAGKGGDRGEKHCGKSDCPVCTSYGFSKDKFSFQGLAQFTDARILFFPVYTMEGPVWVSSPAALEAAGIDLAGGWSAVHEALRGGEHKIWVSPGLAPGLKRLNLGWLYLELAEILTLDPTRWGLPKRMQPLLNRIAIVDDGLFPMVVEDQLEIRTSVSIDPETGAAADTALFTFEAIPRATVLTFFVTVLEPSYFQNPIDKQRITPTVEDIHANVKLGLDAVQWLGLGGSNTRGLGRTLIYSDAEVA